MQSSNQIRKIQDYEIGERVYEEDYYAGRVVSSAIEGVTGYILLMNGDNEYTIYRGITDARCSLTLTRNIPESAAIQFAQAILDAEPLPVARKSPIVKSPVTKADFITETLKSLEPSSGVFIDEDDSLDSPYFDFV
jgi:hypothetical protein